MANIPPRREAVEDEQEEEEVKQPRGQERFKAVFVPEFDSMQQMSSVTGIPLSMLKESKKSGCLFVRHGRCDLVVWLKWFFNRGSNIEQEDRTDWARRDKRAAALIREHNLQKARDQVIDFVTVENFIRELVSVSCFGELDRIKNEFPPNLKGKGELEIFKECDRQVEQVKSNMQTQIETWVEKKGVV